jgi:putative methyltransferase (TIGR04325 family)
MVGTSTAVIHNQRVKDIPSDVQTWSTLESNAFEDPVWIDYARQEVQSLLDRSPETLGDGPQSFLAPLLKGIGLLHASGEAVRILDIGGGVGQTIPYVLENAAHYTVVDGPRNAQLGQALFSDFPQVSFATHIPTDMSFNVVVVNGALQYVRDWAALLKTARSVGASALFVGRLPLGGESTVHGLQNIIVGEPPISAGYARRWIFARQDFAQAASDAGWQLNSDLFIRPSRFKPEDSEAPEQVIEIRSMLLTTVVSGVGLL